MFRQIEVALSPKASVDLSRDGSPSSFSGPIILPLPPGRLPPASGGRSGAVGGHLPVCRSDNPAGNGKRLWDLDYWKKKW